MVVFYFCRIMPVCAPEGGWAYSYSFLSLFPGFINLFIKNLSTLENLSKSAIIYFVGLERGIQQKEAAMAEFDNVKKFIQEYCKILHLANMPAATRERFDKYAEAKDFNGNMKRWPDLLEAADKVNGGDLSALPTMPDDKWKDLYFYFQDIFENMAQHKDDFKYKDETTLKFFNTWFGDDKLFKPSQPAVPGLEDRLTHFAEFLEHNKFALSSIISEKNVYGLNSEFKYDTFVSDVKAGKYKDDPEIRDQLFAVVKYVQNYSDGSNPYYPWGRGVEQYDFSVPTKDGKPALPLDTDEWFATKYNPAFKYRAKEIFNRLLTSSVVREDFTNYDYKGKVAKHIATAINETDYDNKDSKDFVAPVYEDKKTVWQKIGDKIDDFKQDHIDPWANVLRGSRRFFTPYSKEILEAFSKAKNKDGKKLKPTDGLQGVLDYAEAITNKLVAKSPKGKAHFDWLVGKLKIYAEEMPKAFAGAFKRSWQLKAIVSQLIVDGIQEGKVAEAKSAMEVLSTMKYGIFHSRTVDAAGKEDFTLISDKDLSWNKFSVFRYTSKIIDKTAKYALLGLGRGVAAIRNGIFRSRTKFRGKTKYFQAAEEAWKKRNNVGNMEAALENLTNELNTTTTQQTLLNTQIAGFGGRDAMQSDIDAYSKLEDENKGLEKQLKDAQYQLSISGDEETPITDPATGKFIKLKDLIKQLTSKMDANQDLLDNDAEKINGYRTLLKESDDVNDRVTGLNEQKASMQSVQDTWADDHKDKYVELMAFWDMLETFDKSHQLTLAAKKMRKNFLDVEKNKDADGNQIVGDDGKPINKAQSVSNEFLAWYKQKYDQLNQAA